MRWQILPPVVKNLLIINGILFLASWMFEDKFGLDLNQYLGLFFPTSDYFHGYQFLTHLFMHGSFMHILSNMFALWMFGNVLENVWGSRRFLIYYLVTGLGAAVIHSLFTWYELHQMQQSIDLFAAHANPVDFEIILTRFRAYLSNDDIPILNQLIGTWKNSPESLQLSNEAIAFANELVNRKADIPTVGASGAVFGVLLAFGMMFPNTIIYLYFAIPIKAKWFVILYGVFELYSGLQSNPADNVAHFAHLGGMLFGYLLIRAWRNTRYNPYRDDF